MANADGKIVLGLDIQATTANIQTGLDKILNSTKTREIILKTTIEKAEAEKSINALVDKINKNKDITNLGIEVDAKDVHGILAEQQKIASKQAELNRQMKEYRDIAKDIGITLGKDSWNTFNHAIKVGDFSKAAEIIKSAKKQIDEYNKSVAKMNADNSMSGSVSSLIDRFNQLKNVSSDTKKQIGLLKANLAQFENAGSTKEKLSAYNRLKTTIENLTVEYDRLKASEKSLANDNSVRDKVEDIKSTYNSLSTIYSTVDGKAGEAVRESLSELSREIENFEKKSDTLSGGALVAAFDKVDAALDNTNRKIKEFKAEQQSVKFDASISKEVSSVVNSFDKLKTVSDETQTKIDLLNSKLLEFENADTTDKKTQSYKELRSLLDTLEDEYVQLANAEKTYTKDNSIRQKAKDIESYYNGFEIKYAADGDAGVTLKKELATFKQAIDDFKANSQGLSGSKLTAEMDKLQTAYKNATRAIREFNNAQSETGKLKNSLGSITEDIQVAIKSISIPDGKNAGVDNLKIKLRELSNEAETLQQKLANLKPTDTDGIKKTSQEIEALKVKFKSMSSDIKIFSDANDFAQFTANVEKARQKVEQYDKTYSAIKSRPDLVKELEKLKEQANNISDTASLKRFNAEFAKFDTKVIQAGVHTKSLGDRFKTAIQNFGSFFSASRAIYEIIAGFKAMINNVKELDKAMIELKKVTDETDASYERFLTNAKTRAVELGTTVKDLVNATADFSRLGYNLEEATRLGEIATIYANVGDDINSIDDATSSLISTMKAFGMETEDALGIVDRLNLVANNFAVSSGGLGEALRRSASSLSAAGNSIDQSLALITTANTIVQDEAVVGTSLKTMSMRLRAASTELEEAGLDMEGVAKSTSDLREEMLALTGIDVMLDDSTFKSTYQILEELATKWSELTDIQQASVTELVAGKRQGNIMAALMENFDIAQSVLKTSIDSSGSAMEEYSKYLEGIEAKTNRFKAAFESLSLTIVNSDLLKWVIDRGTDLLQLLDVIISKVGSFPALISAIGGSFALFDKNFINFPNVIKNFNALQNAGWEFKEALMGAFSGVDMSALLKYSEAIANGTSEAEAFAEHIDGLGMSTVNAAKQIQEGEKTIKDFGAQSQIAGIKAKAASIGVKALNVAFNMLLSMGVAFAIQGIITVLDNFINYETKAAEAADEAAQKAKETAKARYEEAKSLDELIAKYKELRKEELTDADSRTEIRKIQEEITKLVGTEADNIDLVNGKLDDTLAKLREKARLEARDAQDRAEAEYIKAKHASKTAVGSDSGSFTRPALGNWAYIGERDKEAEKVLQDAGFSNNIASGGWAGSSTYVSDYYNKDGTATKNAKEKAKVLKEMIETLKASEGYDWSNSLLYASLQEEYDRYSAYDDAISEAAKRILDSTYLYQQYDDELAKISVDSIDGYNSYRNKLIDLFSKDEYLNQAIVDGEVTQKNIEDYVDDQLAIEFPDYYKEYSKGKQSLQYRDDLIRAFAESPEIQGLDWNKAIAEVDNFREYIDSLPEEDIEIAGIVVSEQGIGSIEELTAAITEYKAEQASLKTQSYKLKDALADIWNSDDFKDSKKELIELAKTVDGISPHKIKELAKENKALGKVLDTNGMSAEFLAYIFETMADGKDGFALITESALALNGALEGVAKRFDEVSEAKSRYDAAMAVPEKDEDFKSYAEAFETLNAEFEKGTTNSNAFWAAAEFLFGAEQLRLWGWSDGLDKIYESMQKNAVVFGDAESAAWGFLDRLHAISENGQILDDDGNLLGTIEKLADGSYDFNIDDSKLSSLSKELGITEEAILACLQALSMWGDVNFYDIEEVLTTIKDINLASDDIGGTVINTERLVEQLLSLGKTEKDIGDLLAQLKEVEGVTLFEVTAEVDTLTKTLEDLGLATSDGVNIKINYEDVINLLATIGYAKEDAETLITKLGEVDNISLTNAAGEIKSVEDAISHMETVTFAKVTDGADDVNGTLNDVDSSTMDNVVSEVDKLTEAEIKANDEGKNLKKTLKEIDGTEVTVYFQQKEKKGILDYIFGSFAKGTKGAPGGAALVGEEGEELVKSGDKAYFVGTNGAEIVNLNKGDEVYTAEETRKIKRGSSRFIGSIPAYAFGTLSRFEDESDDEAEATVTLDVKADNKALEEKLKDTLDEMKETIDSVLGNYEHEIFIMEKNGADYKDIIAVYKQMQEAVHEQANKYRELGLDENSDFIQDLQREWWSYQDNIVDLHSSALQEILDSAHEAVDEIQGVYNTLTDAAQEYAENGFITVDTLQDILSLGTQYLAYLTDENGQLVINAENINKVIAARTEQLAIETSLNYIESLRSAINDNNTQSLQNLLYATDAATASTWEFVYAQLEALNLSDSQYKAAIQRINTIRALTDTAISGVGKVAGELTENLEAISESLESILDYVIEMIKQETENQIEALEKEVDSYRSIVDLQKKSLELTKEQDEYNKDVSDKLKDISKLQARIAQLSLDDSREAQAEKRSLEAELYDLQGDLSDLQADKAYEAAVESLDKQADAYEEEKQKEIEILEDSISSYEKVYSLAIDRIENNWDSLYRDLIDWNTRYGSDTNEQLTTAWDSASEAVKKYGGYLAAVQSTQAALNAATGATENLAIGNTGNYYEGKDNEANRDRITFLVDQMKSNSKLWATANESNRGLLDAANLDLAKRLEKLIGKTVVRGNDGVWYIGKVGGDLLYDKYHTGGIVGGAMSLKDKETFAVLENGEAVLDADKKETLYKLVDTNKEYGDLLDKFKTMIFGNNALDMGAKLQDIVKNSGNEALNQIDSGNGNNSTVVDASIVIQGNVDNDTWKKIYPVLKQHQEKIAEIVNKPTIAAFNRRGVTV